MRQVRDLPRMSALRRGFPAAACDAPLRWIGVCNPFRPGARGPEAHGLSQAFTPLDS
jgi:hypothetical protein